MLHLILPMGEHFIYLQMNNMVLLMTFISTQKSQMKYKYKIKLIWKQIEILRRMKISLFESGAWQ
jgi:hypothetical protein